MSTLVSGGGRSPLQVAMEAAYQAGDLLLRRAGSEKHIREKSRGNILTDLDSEVEELVVGRLLADFPGTGILAEESGRRGGETEYTWVIDPLDGTRNYASGIPFYAVTIALARGNDVLMGVTYDPNRKEMFRAEKGKGAYLNDVRLGVSRQESLRGCVLGTDMGYSDEMGHYVLRLLDILWPGMQTVRIIGSAALGLAYTAAGRTDLYFHHLLSPWDIAAGILMGREAGGVVTNRLGQPVDLLRDRSVVLSSPTLHAEFLSRPRGLEWRDVGPAG